MSYGYLCGCYYYLVSPASYVPPQKTYLPLLESEVHSTILSTTSKTVLKQTFTNPSTSDSIKECVYTFPLYDGVSVVSFTCRIGTKVLRGLVKEKVKAKEIFDQAVAKGETAGLLEQAAESADVFSTKLGNIPAGESVIVEITYVGELKHHDTDGIRFTIPTRIAPRYGSGPTFSTSANRTAEAQNKDGIKIVVDVNMPEGSFIKGVQSPSHPIAVSMGTVSTATNADPTMSKASATLSLGSAALEKDFVLIVQSKDVGIPKAILETHPTIPNHRAIMATLVPKFTLPPVRPEVVFVADRSGSMDGCIPMLVSAMTVFLKSMPAGVKFNICSFGSSHSFLWPKSKSYAKETLDEATKHLKTFSANMGGTETFGAIRATIERRFPDVPLEIMLLTDGDIWQQSELFNYVNEQVEKTNGNIRIFPLGIGSGVSHSLIEGLARAGNGFAQAVQDGERLDNAVVRMLRGALSPHITDYTLEVKYEQQDDDFEVIDRVIDGMKVLLADGEKSPKSVKAASEKPAISLFDATAEPEKVDIKAAADSKSWLPEIPTPKILQAPHKIPTLFAFSRTSVYLLLSPETIQRNPTAVILRATSNHGPLVLEIPIESLSAPAETIHQLAAKKAVQDLEEGRGWIYDAKDQAGTLIKEKYASSFDDLVKKEAVRLGEKFQIAGKWCSFVAVAANDKEIAAKDGYANEGSAELLDDDDDFSMVNEEIYAHPDLQPKDLSRELAYIPSIAAASSPMSAQSRNRSAGSPKMKKSAAPVFGSVNSAYIPSGSAFGPGSLAYSNASPAYSPASPSYIPASTGSVGSPVAFAAPMRSQFQASAMPPPRPGGGLFGGPPGNAPSAYPQALHGSLQPQQHGALGFSPQAPPPPPMKSLSMERSADESIDNLVDKSAPLSSSHRRMFKESSVKRKSSGRGGGGGGVLQSIGGIFGRSSSSSQSRDSAAKGSVSSSADEEAEECKEEAPVAEGGWNRKSTAEQVLALIALQSFEGYWSDAAACGRITGVGETKAPGGVDAKVWITLLVVKFLEDKCADEEGTWGLVVEKARGWLEGLGNIQLADLEAKAKALIV